MGRGRSPPSATNGQHRLVADEAVHFPLFRPATTPNTGDVRDERTVGVPDRLRTEDGTPMARQNRVTPFGEVIATPERGTLMGNRGVLHDRHGTIRRNWNGKRWIVCLLAFKGRKLEVMKPGCYTQLFYLDEATALAAGHRPCAECRRPRFLDFCAAWQKAHPGDDEEAKPSATLIDDRLHADRLTPDRSRRTFVAVLDDLPDGVFVTLAGSGRQAYLVWGDHLLAWSPGGYAERRRRLQGEEVTVLTPKATVGAIRAGYAPAVHPSAVAPAEGRG